MDRTQPPCNTGGINDLTPDVAASEITMQEVDAYTAFRTANNVKWYASRDRSNFIHGYRAAPSVADYEEVLADHRRLVRELDVLLNGEEGAAKQASLADLVAQLAGERHDPGAGLTPYLRQFQHNDGSGIVYGYDKVGIERFLAPVRRDSQSLARIAELLTFDGKAPQGREETVRTVAAHIRATRENGRIIHDMTVANQAAWIEWKHGGGAEEGMQWIENGLAGPGLLPGGCEDDDIDADDPILKDAQGYFDRYAGWSTAPDPKAVSRTEAAYRAAKNDRELLDFVDAQRVTIKGFTVPTLGGDGAGTFFEVMTSTAIPLGDTPRVLGSGTTSREAIREAIRATDPQADLFAGGAA